MRCAVPPTHLQTKEMSQGHAVKLAVDIRGYMLGALALAYGQMTHLQNETCLANRSILLEGSVVEGQSVLAPGSLLPPGRLIPRGQLWAGCPAQYVRDLSADEVSVPAAGGRLTAVTLQQANCKQQRQQEELQWSQLSWSPPYLQQMLEVA